ncbi:hypothetical protein Hanom_Chr12g01149651 [Helianthus anomalus]
MDTIGEKEGRGAGAEKSFVHGEKVVGMEKSNDDVRGEGLKRMFTSQNFKINNDASCSKFHEHMKKKKPFNLLKEKHR